jgi:hypothetical protein
VDREKESSEPLSEEKSDIYQPSSSILNIARNAKDIHIAKNKKHKKKSRLWCEYLQ